jgi:uncharacterized repeat protein (TIGR01451 family)
MYKNLNKKILIGLVFGVQMLFLCFGTALAENKLPELSLSATSTEAKPGDKITYTISYANTGDVDYSDVQIDMNMLIGNGVVFYNSTLPANWQGDQPYWMIGNLPAGAPSGSFSVTVGINDTYANNSLSSSLLLTGVSNEGTISVGSNNVATNVVKEVEKTEEEKLAEEKKAAEAAKEAEKAKQEESKKEDKTDTDSKLTGELKADGVKKIDIKQFTGGLKLTEEQNINAWDNRYLIVGLIALGLILTVGIAAFFLGKKSN